MAAFIITLRETLEAALIVGLLLSLVNSYYKGIGKGHTYILLGVGIGILLSLVFATGFYMFFGGFEGKVEKIYEGLLMLVAFAMITHLLLWTNKNAKKFHQGVKEKVKNALKKSELWILFMISTLTVSREGVETVIFMNALSIGNQVQNIVYGILGIIGGIVVALTIFFGMKKVSISKVFLISNTLLLFIAAGLLAHSIVEFQGAGVLPTFVKPVFDLSQVLSEKEGAGSFLKTMFGYDANPSLLALIAYISYLLYFLKYFKNFGPKKKT